MILVFLFIPIFLVLGHAAYTGRVRKGRILTSTFADKQAIGMIGVWRPTYADYECAERIRISRITGRVG